MSVVTVEMQNQVSELYITFFGRAPDAIGFAHWTQALANGATVQQIGDSFAETPEFQSNYGGLTPSESVNRFYQNTLNRPADSEGLAYWTNLLNNGVSFATVAYSIVNTAFAGAGNPNVNPSDVALVNNKVTISKYFAIDLASNDFAVAQTAFIGVDDTEASVIAKEAELDAEVNAGTTYTLTTGVDTQTAQVFTGIVNGVIGAATTFTTLDTLTGEKTDASLNTLQLINANNTALDTSLITPLGASLRNIGNLEIVGDGSTASAGAGGVSTAGSLFAGVTKVTLENTGVSVLTGSATQDLIVTNTAQANNAVAINGGKSVTATLSGVTSGTTVVGTTTAPSGAVIVNSTGTAYAAGEAATSTLGNIQVAGGTTVNVTQIAASSTAAAATDTSNATRTLGAVTVTGGAATDSVTVTQSAAVTAVNASATATGKMGVVNGDVDVLDVNRTEASKAGTITTVTINNAAATTINSGALTTLNLGGTLDTVNAGTLGALTTAANDKLAVNLTDVTSTGALTIDTDIKTINFNVTGADESTLGGLVNLSATAINIAGDAALTISASTVAAKAVYTSTNSAGVTITPELGVDQKFVGGDGDDTVSVGATKTAINMGAGDDVVTISTTTLGTGGTIDGGTGTNTIVANTNGSALASNANISNFQTLRVAGTAAEGSHSATGFTALEVGGIKAGGNTVTFTTVAAGTGLTYIADPGATNGVAYQLANSTGTADALDVTLSSAAALDARTLTAAGIETVSITNNDTNTTAQTNVMTLTADAAKSITVSGNAGLNLTATGSTKVTNFDATGVTGAADDAAALGVTYASLNATRGTAVSITGGSGDDTLTGNITNDSMIGGAGDDTIAGGTGSDVIDGGTGENTYAATASQVGANVEGAGTGTSTGLVINLSDTAVTNAAVLGATGDNLAGLKVSVDASSTAYLFGSSTANTNSTVSTSLTNIQNVNGSTGADYIIGSDGDNVLAGLGGADVLTGGDGNDVFSYVAVSNSAASVAASAVVTFDTITDFTAGEDGIDVSALNGTAFIAASGTATGTTVTTLDTTDLGNTNIATFAQLKTAIDTNNLFTASAAGAAGANTGLQVYVIDLTGNTGSLGTGTFMVVNNGDALFTADDVMIAWTGTSEAPVGGDFILA